MIGMFDTIFTAASIGLVAGFALGLTGMGWGSISVPLLILLGFEPSIVVGSVLPSNILTSTVAGVTHWRNNNSDKRSIILLTGGGVASAALGSVFSLNFKLELISTLLAIYLVVGGITIIISQNRPPERSKENGVIKFIAVGAIPGFFEGAYGSGGPAGILSLLLLRVKAHRAVGSWLPASAAIQIVPTTIYLAFLRFNWEIFLGLLVTGIPAAIVGSKMNMRIPERLLKCLIGVVIMFLGVRLSLSVK
jgi:uncharacterized membrane protein YfcA